MSTVILADKPGFARDIAWVVGAWSSAPATSKTRTAVVSSPGISREVNLRFYVRRRAAGGRWCSSGRWRVAGWAYGERYTAFDISP